MDDVKLPAGLTCTLTSSLKLKPASRKPCLWNNQALTLGEPKLVRVSTGSFLQLSESLRMPSLDDPTN